jgi:hypothetical protein
MHGSAAREAGGVADERGASRLWISSSAYRRIHILGRESE